MWLRNTLTSHCLRKCWSVSAGRTQRCPTECWSWRSWSYSRCAQLSEAQAAALLQLDRWELLEMMGRYRVPAIRMSQEELQQELTRTLPGDGPV